MTRSTIGHCLDTRGDIPAADNSVAYYFPKYAVKLSECLEPRVIHANVSPPTDLPVTISSNHLLEELFTMTIRSLEPADRARWESLLRAYAAFYGTSTSSESEAIVWGWIFDEHNDFWCDLAVDTSGTIIGFVQYQLMHRSLSGAMVCYLSDLYVDPQSRGHGAGRDMINHVLAFARNRGITNVRWLTQEFNYSGRRLYDTYTKKSDFILYSVPINNDEPDE